jgi:hypothetical protein
MSEHGSTSWTRSRTVDQEGGIATIVDEKVGAVALRPVQCLLCAPPVLLECLALPGEHSR